MKSTPTRRRVLDAISRGAPLKGTNGPTITRLYDAGMIAVNPSLSEGRHWRLTLLGEGLWREWFAPVNHRELVMSLAKARAIQRERRSR